MTKEDILNKAHSLSEKAEVVGKIMPKSSIIAASIDMAEWVLNNLWKPADGEDLPELEREVVVLVDNFGKLIPKLAKRTYHLIENFVDEDTGEIISIENTDKVGDIINWTEPAIYWLDVDIPKLEED